MKAASTSTEELVPMKPSTNIPTPSDPVSHSQLPISGPNGPDWMYTLARVFRRNFIALDDETGDKLCNIEDLVKMIAHYAPSPSPVPTDDGLEMAAKWHDDVAEDARWQIKHGYGSQSDEFYWRDSAESHERYAAAIRALKGNSLPAPAIEDVHEFAARVGHEIASDECFAFTGQGHEHSAACQKAQRILAREAADLLQSTTPPAVSGRDK